MDGLENTAPAQETNTVTPESAENTGTPAAQTEPTPQPQQTEQQEPQEKGTILGGNGNTEQTENPTAPVQYDFSQSIPDGFVVDEKTTGEFSAIAHSLNLDNTQANKLAAYGMNYAQRTIDAMQAAEQAQYEAWADESRQKLGADFDKTVALAGAAIEKLEPSIPNIRQVLNQNGMGNRVEVIQLLAKFGEMVSEDRGGALSANGNAASDPLAARYGNTDFSKYK